GPPPADHAGNVESITAVGTVRLRLDSQTPKGGPGPGHQAPVRPAVLDGDIWQCGSDGEILVPPGQHWLGGVPREQALIDRLRAIGSGTALLRDITAEVQRVSRTSLGLGVDYQAPPRARAAPPRRPIPGHIRGSTTRTPAMAA